MELANKFNKAEAKRERERDNNFVGVGAVSMHHLRSAMPSKQAKQPIERQRADFAAPQQPCLARLREEEDDVEWKGKLGPLSRRKLFSSFLSFGDGK